MASHRRVFSLWKPGAAGCPLDLYPFLHDWIWLSACRAAGQIAIGVPRGEHRAGDLACPARYAARLMSQGSQKLGHREVVRIAENQPVDEDPGMSLEHAHDQFTSPPVKIVQAHDEVRVPRRELT